MCCKRNNTKKEGDVNLENPVENYQNNMVPTGLNTFKNTSNKNNEIKENKKNQDNKTKKNVYSPNKISKTFHPKSKNLKRVTTAITTNV